MTAVNLGVVLILLVSLFSTIRMDRATASSSTSQDAWNGHGLLAEFYTNTGDGDFEKVEWKSSAVVPNVEFSNLDPILQTHTGQSDDANIYFSGQISPKTSEDYTFYMIGDNGFRLWIDNQLVIDYWVNDWDKEQTSDPIHLEAGKKYDVKIEYFEDFGGSNLYLRWSSPSVKKEIVPETAFTLPSDYTGPVQGTITSKGNEIELHFQEELDRLPVDIASNFSIKADNNALKVEAIELHKDNSSIVNIQLEKSVRPETAVHVEYDGNNQLTTKNGQEIARFKFTPENKSEFIDYSPMAIAMTFYGDPKTQRAFAWYTNHEFPENAPENVLDSIVEIVPAGASFESDAVIRFEGESQVLNLRITNSTNGTFASHKVLATGLMPGTAYEYRVGSDGNWSEVGAFTTEAEDEIEYEFLYMTDSQGANTKDYEVWADTLRQGIHAFPDSKFLVMSGDMVDAGALEYQWLDFFGKPQEQLMKLPIMAAVGNHEGPYNDNYYYHFHYPNDSIDNPLPPGSVYSYDYGDAHFMIINTMDMGWDDRQRESFGQQIEWLKREVAETDKKWKIVAFHKAIYSVGGHAVDSDILELREMLYPVFDELGIDVVLQGHDHSFMRSYQMYDDKPIKDVTTDGKGRVINPDGTMYIVNNSAGTKYYDVREDVDKYYAAKFEQPRQPIYSGITMTENSLTIESFKSGEDQPFDTYTIVRDDNKPNKVEQLSAVQRGKLGIELSWKAPENKDEKDPIRGFRIFEKNGRLGKNWSTYIPVEEGKELYQYVVKEAKSNEQYEFAVTAVDKRDNSAPSYVSTDSIKIAAPTNPVVDDGFNTFAWTNVPGYEELSNYEYSIDGGKTWNPVTANPQPVGDKDIPKGDVQVRVIANGETGQEAGLPLIATEAFTVNSVKETFALDGQLERVDDQLMVNIEIDQQANYGDNAYVVIELFDGNTPVIINAIPITQKNVDISQYYNDLDENHFVKIFVVNEFTSELEIPVPLAKPIELK